MRILHTSDWHAGRLWKGQNRLAELQDVLEHLGDLAERERVDLVLMSGDVFDHQMPTAEAERAVSQFFCRLGRARVPSVVVAGNHDHPMRMDTWGLLAGFVGVQARGLPRPRSQGGLIEVPTRSGETACVAAVPFAPAGRLVEALTLARDDTQAKQLYAEAMAGMLEHLAGGFRADAVNLVVGHTHVAGAKASGSERVVTLGDDWAATAQSLPVTAQYVALGHIHRPQRVEAAGPHTEYAGSPMQLDFGEVDDEKSCVLIDVRPGKPPRAERVPYQGGRRLGHWAGTLAELERDAAALQQRFGYLRVAITLEAPMADLNRRARQIAPNVVVVQPVEPEVTAPGADDIARPDRSAAPVDHFRAFYQREHHRQPDASTLDLFAELYTSAAAAD